MRYALTNKVWQEDIGGSRITPEKRSGGRGQVTSWVAGSRAILIGKCFIKCKKPESSVFNESKPESRSHTRRSQPASIPTRFLFRMRVFNQEMIDPTPRLHQSHNMPELLLMLVLKLCMQSVLSTHPAYFDFASPFDCALYVAFFIFSVSL